MRAEQETAMYDQPDYPEPPIGPDCEAGKCRACDGRAWDDDLDGITDCACDCHEEGIE